jgi:hypothetical protein
MSTNHGNGSTSLYDLLMQQLHWDALSASQCETLRLALLALRACVEERTINTDTLARLVTPMTGDPRRCDAAAPPRAAPRRP